MERTIGKLLSWTAREAREVLEQRLQAAGGSFSTWLTLHQLDMHEGDRQRDLAELLCVEGSTMTRHLDRMEAQGLIERRPDRDDRRGIRVYLTPAGRELEKELTVVMNRSHQDLLHGLSVAEAEMLRDLLNRMRENVRSAAESDGASSAERLRRRALA